MTRGAWMCRQYDDGLKIWLAAPRENEKPFIDSERAQKWRLSLASLLFFTVLLSDHLWFCAEAKLTRTRDKEQHQHRQRRQQQQRHRQHEPSWPALLASMGESSPAAQAHRLLSASSSPTLPPSPGDGGGGGGKGNRGKNNRSKALFLGNSAKPVWRLETCYPQGASSGQCFTVESADAVCARNWSRGVAAAGEEQPVRGTHPAPLWNLSDFYLSFCNSYTLWELFSGLSSPNTLNCSLDVVLKEGGEMTTCRQCVEAYQDYDHHAQEKYEEFESVLHKYLQSEEYSVKSCPEDCKGKLGWLLGAIGREGVGQLCFLTRWLQPKSKGSHGERDPHANACDLAAHWSCESLALICSEQVLTLTKGSVFVPVQMGSTADVLAGEFTVPWFHRVSVGAVSFS
ncbi:NALCN channel auxiliary factor 1-like [Callorhinus ursinus]|uniref:NALCN channel auxiliary factor 1-like n=1 Tax=Callorhinus ursinus TaxID=34884 RepID=UPI003CD04495